MLFGINIGGFDGGTTGIPFTDPIFLASECAIPNYFVKRAELSSGFIYEVIKAYGGCHAFFPRFFITGISPLGYMANGKNLNYYDLKNRKTIFKKDIPQWSKRANEIFC